jgi:hypothetical protein
LLQDFTIVRFYFRRTAKLITHRHIPVWHDRVDSKSGVSHYRRIGEEGELVQSKSGVRKRRQRFDEEIHGGSGFRRRLTGKSGDQIYVHADSSRAGRFKDLFDSFSRQSLDKLVHALLNAWRYGLQTEQNLTAARLPHALKEFPCKRQLELGSTAPGETYAPLDYPIR